MTQAGRILNTVSCTFCASSVWEYLGKILMIYKLGQNPELILLRPVDEAVLKKIKEKAHVPWFGV